MTSHFDHFESNIRNEKFINRHLDLCPCLDQIFGPMWQNLVCIFKSISILRYFNWSNKGKFLPIFPDQIFLLPCRQIWSDDQSCQIPQILVAGDWYFLKFWYRNFSTDWLGKFFPRIISQICLYFRRLHIWKKISWYDLAD